MRWARRLNGAWWLACYVWPGLAPLWLRGSWAALAAAAVFALLLNITLAATCLWSELLAPPMRGGMWVAVSIAWLLGVVANCRWRGWRFDETTPHGGRDLFPDAVGEYLRGNWIEAENLVGRILHQRPEDMEARLLWVSVLRRTRRTEEALRRLRDLNRLESAKRWRWEIEAEMEHLERTVQNVN